MLGCRKWRVFRLLGTILGCFGRFLGAKAGNVCHFGGRIVEKMGEGFFCGEEFGWADLLIYRIDPFS